MLSRERIKQIPDFTLQDILGEFDADERGVFLII